MKGPSKDSGGTIRASLLRLFGPCAAKGSGRWVPFSQAACAVWIDNRPVRLCFRIHHHSSEVSAWSMKRELHHHETGGTSALPRRVPSFQASRQPELCVRFQRVRCSTGASLTVFQCHPARVVLIRAILSNDSQSPMDGLLTTMLPPESTADSSAAECEVNEKPDSQEHHPTLITAPSTR
jgi:hypothetical protein